MIILSRFSWIREAFNKERRFTIGNTLVLVGGFLARSVIVVFGLGVAQSVVQPAAQQSATFRGIVSNLNIPVLVVITIVLVGADYIKDITNRQLRASEYIKERIVFQLISGAIGELLKRKGSENPQHYFSDLLKRIEKAVETILKESGLQVGIISANMMVPIRDPDNNPADDSDSNSVKSLELRYWGTRLADRDYITIPIDRNSPSPGAAGAYINKKIVYIESTLSDKYREHFDQTKEYRSIISVPVELDRNVYAVVNIDSTEENQFRNEKFISANIEPRIKPFINLIALEHECM